MITPFCWVGTLSVPRVSGIALLKALFVPRVSGIVLLGTLLSQRCPELDTFCPKGVRDSSVKDTF